MKRQKKIIISIGSNKGNRQANLQQAIDAIHANVGTVVTLSKIYETPSWGFESDAFLNAALLVYSEKEAQQVLDELLAIEAKIGRVRSGNTEYQARVIDLDIIAFDDEIIKTETLQVPHPQMQNRKFVLLPMQEVVPNWVHPQFKKSLSELIDEVADESNCVFFGNLNNPTQQLRLQNSNYIVIEGNIGSGKTTLATKISENLNTKLVLEQFADNPFLPKFYEDPSRYAFPLELSFLTNRYRQLLDNLKQLDLRTNFVVADYHVFKSLIFAKTTLQQDEFNLYKTMFGIIHKDVPKPDLYVYLYQTTDRLLENIKNRGRSYEQEISATYLEQINNGYLDYIKTQTNLNVLVINTSNLDFVSNPNDYHYILIQIHKALAK